MIHHIGNEEIMAALDERPKQYLVGNLRRPQKLKHIRNTGLEIGITRMNRGQKVPAHYHTMQYELVYVLQGTFCCIDMCGETRYIFHAGDFFLIENNTVYEQEALEDCLLYFVKYPATDDKIDV